MPAKDAFLRYRLLYGFLFSFSLLLFLPLLMPSLRLTYFAPYLIWIFYRRPLYSSLWQAFFCGLTFDLFSSCSIFGLTSLQYCLTTLIIYPQTRHFFEDKASTLPSMTAFFAIISTMIQAVLLGFFGQDAFFSWKWVGTDLIVMPVLDACYAVVCFSLPFQLYRWVSKIISSPYTEK